MSDKNDVKWDEFKNKVKNLVKGESKKNSSLLSNYLKYIKYYEDFSNEEIIKISERVNKIMDMLKLESNSVLEKEYMYDKALSLIKYRYVNLIIDGKYDEIFNPSKSEIEKDKNSWPQFKVRIMNVAKIGLAEASKIGSILKKEKDIDKWKDEEILSRYQSIKKEEKLPENKKEELKLPNVKENISISTTPVSKIIRPKTPKPRPEKEPKKVIPKKETPKVDVNIKTPKQESKESESDSDSSNDSNNGECSLHIKKKSIPKYIKTLIWNKYIGEDKAIAKCMSCRQAQISVNHFHAGHVISEAKGGDITINNLRPICGSCNLGMGKMDMNTFTKEYFGWEIK